MDRLLTLRDVEHFTGLRKSSLYSLIADKKFSPPIKIGLSSRWPSSEISDWVQDPVDHIIVVALVAVGAAREVISKADLYLVGFGNALLRRFQGLVVTTNKNEQTH